MADFKEALLARKNIDPLTWLRGIAAFFVILSHTSLAVSANYLGESRSYYLENKFWFDFFGIGGLGVTLFFVLSGCTLFLIYQQMSVQDGTFKFYLKRFMRIYPAYFISILFYMAFRPVFTGNYMHADGFWIERQFMESLNWQVLVQYFTLSFNLFHEHTLLNNAYWSLPVEFQFYLLFPLALLLNRKVPLVGIVVMTIFLYLFAKYFDLPGKTLQRFWEFSGGMLIAYVAMNINYRISMKITIPIVILLILLAMYINGLGGLTMRFIPSNTFEVVISYIIVFLALISIYRSDSKFAKFFLHYGEISYSTYLYHNLFIGAAILYCVNNGVAGMDKLYIVFPVAVIFTFFAATISYKYIERPGMNLGKILVRKK